MQVATHRQAVIRCTGTVEQSKEFGEFNNMSYVLYGATTQRTGGWW